MKPNPVITAAAIVALAALCAAQPVGGVALHETGSADMGSSYAGAGARANDASTVFLNPAGMTRLDGTQMVSSLGLAWFNVEIDLEHPGTNPVFPPGSLNGGGYHGAVAPLLGSYLSLSLTDDLKAGISVTAPYGAPVDFNQDWIGAPFVVESTILGFDGRAALAYRVADWLSIGGGVDVWYGTFDQEALASPFPGSPPVKLDADGWSVGGNAGVLFELDKLLGTERETRVGVAYLSGFDIDFEGDFYVGNFSRLDATVTFHMPHSIGVHAFHEVTDELALLADFGWTSWSDFARVPITLGGITTIEDRKWKDTYRLAVGAQYQAMENLLVRTGFSWDSEAVSPEHLLPDIPTGDAYRISVGGTYDVNEHISFSTSYTAMILDLAYDHVPLRETGVVLHGEYDPSIAHMFGMAIDLNWGGAPDSDP